MEREMNVQFVMILIFQTLGTAAGVLVGDLAYTWSGSLEWCA